MNLDTTVVYTRQLPRIAESALDPLAEEISWGRLRLTGADPSAIAGTSDQVAADRAMAQILEIGAVPGRVGAIVQISASTAKAPLDISLMLGNCGSRGTTAKEAEAACRVASKYLAGHPACYQLDRADPAPLFHVHAPNCVLIRQRSVTFADAEDCVSIPSRFDRGADSWLSLAGLLHEYAPVHFRASVFATELGLSDHLELREQLAVVQQMRRRADGDMELAHRAVRAASTILDVMESFQTPVYVFEVALLSDYPLPEALVRAAAAAITRELDVVRVGETPDVAARRRIVGGFRVETDPPGHLEAFKYGLPLHGGLGPRELTDLVSLHEASCLIQIPVPAGAPVPTVPVQVATVLPAPSGLPDSGIKIGADVDGAPIYLSESMLRSSVHICGASGSGKTTAILAIAKSMLAQGKFFVFIDPHGTAARQVTELAAAMGRPVVVIDPADPKTASIALWEGITKKGVVDPDLLDRSNARIMDFFTSHLPAEWAGPRWRASTRAPLTLVSHVLGCGLADVGRVLTDEDYRRELISRAEALPAWVPAYLEVFSQQREWADVAQWVSAKFDDIAMRQGLKRVFASVGKGTTFSQFIANRTPVVVNLAKGYLSSLDSGLIGHVVLSGFIDAAFARPDDEREPFLLIADEAGALPAQSLMRALLECRKFGLYLVVSHQHLSQLDDSLQDAVLTSPTVRIAFRLPYSDAVRLAPSFGVTPRDLAGLPDLRAYVQCAPQGRLLPTFSLELPLAPEILSGGWDCSSDDGQKIVPVTARQATAGRRA